MVYLTQLVGVNFTYKRKSLYSDTFYGKSLHDLSEEYFPISKRVLLDMVRPWPGKFRNGKRVRVEITVEDVKRLHRVISMGLYDDAF